MQAVQEKGSDEKHEVAKMKEEKTLDILKFLKAKRGILKDRLMTILLGRMSRRRTRSR